MDSTAADTLDRIREGTTYVVALAHQRLDDTRDALVSGDFRMARRYVREAINRIDSLATAEVNFGQWEDLRIVRGMDLIPGSRVYCWDTVKEIVSEYGDPTGDGDRVIVCLGERGETNKFFARSEVIVFLDEE